jgi:hypothetical protein
VCDPEIEELFVFFRGGVVPRRYALPPWRYITTVLGIGALIIRVVIFKAFLYTKIPYVKILIVYNIPRRSITALLRYNVFIMCGWQNSLHLCVFSPLLAVMNPPNVAQLPISAVGGV